MDKWQKAQIAELKVELTAAEVGAIVSKPTTSARYDYVIDWNGTRYRAQVKYGGGTSSHSNGCVVAELRKEGKTYTGDEIDVLLVYIPSLDRVCWFDSEIFRNKRTLYIRIEPSRNAQVQGCLMAKDYFWE